MVAFVERVCRYLIYGEVSEISFRGCNNLLSKMYPAVAYRYLTKSKYKNRDQKGGRCREVKIRVNVGTMHGDENLAVVERWQLRYRPEFKSAIFRNL